MITDPSGNVLRRYDYLPDGQVISTEGSGTPWNRVQFGGKERDPETGFGSTVAPLDYVGARYYQQQLGRFMATDPALEIEKALVDPQRWNRYTYALNNPLRFIDPDGKHPVLIVAAAAWGLYELGSTIYDAYTTYKTLTSPDASTSEKFVTTGLFLAGVLPGVPGGGTSAAKTVIRRAGDIADAAETGFHSFSAFKRAFGAAGEGLEWHHIVEQTAANVSRFGSEAIHNTRNVIALPVDVHRQISAYYSSKQAFTKGLTVRQWLRTQSLKEQQRFGRELLEELGVVIP
jgi:RHS repeat-associated protein